MPKVKEGVVLYDAESDGFLNGVYTNEQCQGHIQTETLTNLRCLRGTTTWFPIDLPGIYSGAFLEWEGNTLHKIDVEVQVTRRAHTNVYDVEWTDPTNRNPMFRGVGFVINPRQFLVRYESV